MTYKTNRYGTYEIDHTTFGGLIYPSDFNTDYRGKDNNNGSQIAKSYSKKINKLINNGENIGKASKGIKL